MIHPSRTLTTTVAALALCACQDGSGDPDLAFGPGQADVPPPGAEYEGAAFTFDTIVPGIYHARGTGNLVAGSNGTVVVNDEDVLLVDSHMTPAAAWALTRELRHITDKPIRYVVNAHFHFDHAGGNQIFSGDVEIIGHPYTRRMMEAGYAFGGRSYQTFVGTLPDRIQGMRAALDTMTDAGARAEAEWQLRIQEQWLEADAAVVTTPPNLTITQQMTLFRGGREIRILFLGRGHTEGDVVVYLPGDGLVITGDLITGGIPYLGDGYAMEWAETLLALKALDFEVIVPGHGPAFRDPARVDQLSAYLRDLWQQVEALHGLGVSMEEAVGRVDMSAHDVNPNPQAGVSTVAVRRIYELLNGTEEGHEIGDDGP
jgi:glyoxylase-like metal-dependent hydrolase (beta-lactamase superfamily II)